MPLKKILGLIIALLLACGLAGTVSWAYFNDPEGSSDNILLTGTVDISPSITGTGPGGKTTVISEGNQGNSKVDFNKLVPGESGNVSWVLTNTGKLAGTLVITSSVIFSENSSNEIELVLPDNNYGGNGDLDTFVGIKLQRGIGSDEAGAWTALTYILGTADYFVPLSGLETALNSAGTVMDGNEGNDTVVFYLSWSIANPLKGAGTDGLFGTGDDTSVNNNIIQSDSAKIDITFTINQLFQD